MRTTMLAALLLIPALPALPASSQGRDVDVSPSMDPVEQEVQREGYVAAFRSAAVKTAIRQGHIERIAVTDLETAGRGGETPLAIRAGADVAAQDRARRATSCACAG